MSAKLRQIVPHSARASFWLGFVLCFSAGFFIIFVLSPLTGVSKSFGGPGHDGYIEIAGNIIRGNGFVCEKGGAAVACPPFYPVLLSPLTLLPEGLQRPCLILVQSLMAGLIASLIFRIGKYLFGVSAAGTAVIIFLLNPWLYWNAKNPMTVITQGLLYVLFVFLTGSSIYVVLKGAAAWGKKRWLMMCLAMGGTGGALILSHGAMLMATIVLLFILFVTGIVRRSYRAVSTSIISGMIIILTVSPWTYRNWVVFGRFIPVSSNYGYIYFQGLLHWNICGDDAQRPNETYRAAALRFLDFKGDESEYLQCYGLKDAGVDAAFNDKMHEHIRTYPGVFAKKMLLNSVEYYFPMLTYPFLAVKILSVENVALTIFHLVLWVLAFVGMRGERQEKASRLPTCLMLCSILLYGIWYLPFVTFIGHSLYTFGTIPFLSILAARAFARLRIMRE